MKTQTKKWHFFFFIAFFFSSLIFWTGCDKEEPIDLTPMLLDCNSFRESNADKIIRLENRHDGIDYLVDCRIVVDIDLIIDPGVTIAFTTGSGMSIAAEGSLHAVGTVADPIEFTGEDEAPGAWLGILSYSNDVKNTMNHVIISYAGGGAFNSNGDKGSLILWGTTYLKVSNTSIRDGAAAGINANYSGYDVEFNNVTISGCSIAIHTADPNMIGSISGGSFTGNNLDIISIGKAGSPVLETSQTWADLGVPYRISTSGLILRDATLTIEPGVVMEFENGARFLIGHTSESTLIAVGTPENPIIFTGVTKASGAWKHIDFHATKSPLNEIGHAIIEYAGNPGAEGAILMRSKPVINVHNVHFKDIAACAIYDDSYPWDPSPNLTESNNTLENVDGGYMCID